MPNNVRVLFQDHAILLNCEMKTLVVSDIHLGYEVELIRKGVSVPHRASVLANELTNLGKRLNTKSLYILGDIKHKIATASNYDLFQITQFFEKLGGWFEKVEVTLGNHDGGIKRLLPSNISVYGSRGTIVECNKNIISLLHGHAFPPPESVNSNYIITGHGHYMIELRDSLGLKFSEPVWIIGEIDRKEFFKKFYKSKIRKDSFEENIRFIVLPPFNRIVGGISVDKAVEGSGILKYMVAERTKLFLDDGTYLTTFSNLAKMYSIK